MKLYTVRYSYHNADCEWHSGDVYSTAAIFVNKNEAEELRSKILEIKNPWRESESKYDVYISELEEGQIKDGWLKSELDSKREGL